MVHSHVILLSHFKGPYRPTPLYQTDLEEQERSFGNTEYYGRMGSIIYLQRQELRVIYKQGTISVVQ